MASDRAAIRILVVDDNPFVRRTLENRGRGRPDVSLQTFAGPGELRAHLEAIDSRSVDLIVCDGEIEGCTASADLVDELLGGGWPVLLVVDDVAAVASREGLLRAARPVSFEEIVTAARWRAKRASSMELRSVGTSTPTRCAGTVDPGDA
jgi:hypothetical protein